MIKSLKGKLILVIPSYFSKNRGILTVLVAFYRLKKRNAILTEAVVGTLIGIIPVRLEIKLEA